MSIVSEQIDSKLGQRSVSVALILTDRSFTQYVITLSMLLIPSKDY